MFGGVGPGQPPGHGGSFYHNDPYFPQALGSFGGSFVMPAAQQQGAFAGLPRQQQSFFFAGGLGDPTSPLPADTAGQYGQIPIRGRAVDSDSDAESTGSTVSFASRRSRHCIVALVVLTLVAALVSAALLLLTLFDAAFSTFDQAADSVTPRVSSTLHCLLVLLALVVALTSFGLFAGNNGLKVQIATFAGHGFIISILVLLCSKLALAHVGAAESVAFRAANEVCQKAASLQTLWGCHAEGMAASRRLGAHAAAEAIRTALQGKEAVRRCEGYVALCTPPTDLDLTHACLCAAPATAIGSQQTPAEMVAAAPRGSYCEDWDAAGNGPWCNILPGVTCGQASTDPTTGALRSTGPCGRDAATRSAMMLSAAAAYRRGLWSLVVVALPLLLASFLSWCRAGCYCCFCCASATNSIGAYDGEPRSIRCPLCCACCFRRRHGSTLRSTELVALEQDQLEDRFGDAQAYAAENLRQDTADNLRLAMYAYYMQATRGDCASERSPHLSWSERKKHDAWEARRGMSKQEAMRKYIETVAEM